MKVKKKWISILIAIFFSYFTFLYTWKKDKNTFIICAGIVWLFILTQMNYGNLIYGIVWIFTMFSVLLRDKKWYKNYYKKEDKNACRLS